MSDMNVSESLIPQLAMANPVVQMLEGFLSEARAGRISSVGIIISPPQGGFGAFYVGPQRGDLFIGAHSLAKKVLNDVETPPKMSPIIRASMNG